LGPTVARNSKGDSEDKKDDEVAVSDSEVNEASTNCDVIGRMVGVVAAAVEMWLVNVAGCRCLSSSRWNAAVIADISLVEQLQLLLRLLRRLSCQGMVRCCCCVM